MLQFVTAFFFTAVYEYNSLFLFERESMMGKKR